MYFQLCCCVDDLVALLPTSGECRHDDPQLNCTPATSFKDFVKDGNDLNEENYNLIEKGKVFEQLQVIGDQVSHLN